MSFLLALAPFNETASVDKIISIYTVANPLSTYLDASDIGTVRRLCKSTSQFPCQTHAVRHFTWAVLNDNLSLCKELLELRSSERIISKAIESSTGSFLRKYNRSFVENLVIFKRDRNPKVQFRESDFLEGIVMISMLGERVYPFLLETFLVQSQELLRHACYRAIILNDVKAFKLTIAKFDKISDHSFDFFYTSLGWHSQDVICFMLDERIFNPDFADNDERIIEWAISRDDDKVLRSMIFHPNFVESPGNCIAARAIRLNATKCLSLILDNPPFHLTQGKLNRLLIVAQRNRNYMAMAKLNEIMDGQNVGFIRWIFSGLWETVLKPSILQMA